MKPICSVREFTGEAIHNALIHSVSENVIPEKAKVLKYLKSFKADCAAGMSLVDEITGEKVGPGVEGFEDGNYYWDSREIYHFEKYNMALNYDFIEYVLSR